MKHDNDFVIGFPFLRHWIFKTVIAVILLIATFMSYDIIPPGHRGVKVTLGKVDEQEVGEGFVTHLPLVTSVHEFSIRQKTMQGKAACFSKDLQTLNIQFAVLYSTPAQNVVPLYRSYSGDVYESLVEPRMQECLKQVTSKYPAEEAVQKRDEIRMDVLRMLQNAVKELTIVDLAIVNVDLTDDLEKSIEMKMVQQQKALTKRYELEAEQRQAEITVVQAKAEAESVKIKGEAVLNNPMVIDLEIVKKWDGHSPSTVVTDGGSRSSVLLPIKGSGGNK